MYNKILVPLDGSALAERALEPAMALAGSGNGEVTLLRVPSVHPVSVDTYSGGYRWLYPDQAQAETLQEAGDYLDDLVRQYASPSLTVRRLVVEGDPAAVIVDVAADEAFDLICMTTHGYSGLTLWMLGSVAERVLRAAPCPVMIIREQRPIRHLLITLDGSEQAERALKPGLEAARRFGARVTLLQVAMPVLIPHEVVYHLEMTEDAVEYLASSAIDHAELYLLDVARRCEEREVPLAVKVEEGLAAPQIIEFAESNDVDLIVMATHGRTGLQRWAYGSVTEKLLRSGHCSMLVVRPEQKPER